MSVYTPDTWVILEIQSAGETFYKVLGGWSGGYLNGLETPRLLDYDELIFLFEEWHGKKIRWAE